MTPSTEWKEVLAGLPPHARVGMFAEPKKYDAVVRFSNGGAAPASDQKPDVRGIAVKVIGVGGKKLIPGMESAVTQDFLAILTASQPFATPEDFVWFVVAARSPATLLPRALFRLGPGRLLEKQPVRWDLQMQFFTDEQNTPLEDSTRDWNAPWVPVAKLTLPQQTMSPAFSTWAEGLSFDPWHAQEEFRPLGAMMRARNAAYRVSTQARKASVEPTALP